MPGGPVGTALLNTIVPSAVTSCVTAHLAAARLIGRQALTGLVLVRPGALHPALVDVADEQVRAALVAELADLPQELLNRDRGSSARRLRRWSR